MKTWTFPAFSSWGINQLDMGCRLKRRLVEPTTSSFNLAEMISRSISAASNSFSAREGKKGDISKIPQKNQNCKARKLQHGIYHKCTPFAFTKHTINPSPRPILSHKSQPAQKKETQKLTPHPLLHPLQINPRKPQPLLRSSLSHILLPVTFILINHLCS